MAALGRLVVTMSANIAEFTAAMDKASMIAAQRARQIQRALQPALAVIGKAAAAMAVAVVAAVKKAVDAGSDISDFSQSVGMGAVEFQKLGAAAAQSGIRTEEFRAGLAKLADGVAQNIPALQAMGISVRNANGEMKSSGDVLLDIADKFTTYKDGANKIALANDVFGKSGSRWVPVLNQGSKALVQFGNDAEASGRILSQQAVDALDAFGDRMDMLKTQITSMAGNFTIGLIPALEKVGSAFSSSANSAEGWKTLGEEVGKWVLKISGGLTAVAGLLAFSTQRLSGYATAWTRIFKGDFAGAQRALDENLEDSLINLGKWMDKAGIMLGVGTASAIREAKAAADAVAQAQNEASRKASQTREAPTTQGFTDAQKEAVAKQRELAAIVKEVSDEYDKATKSESQLLEQRLRLAGASEELVQQMQSMALATDIAKSREEALLDLEKQSNETIAEQKRLRESLPDLYYDVASAAEKYQIDLKKILDLEQALIVAGADYAEVQKFKAAALQDLAERYKPAAEGAKDLANVIAKSFEDAILSGRSLSDVLKALAEDILRIIIRVQVTKPLEDALTAAMSGGSGGGGNWFTKLLGNLVGGVTSKSASVASSTATKSVSSAIPWVSPWNGGGRALGGDVMKGRTYLVGELGPELFTAINDGRIIPHAQLAKLVAAKPAKDMERVGTLLSTMIKRSPMQKPSADGSRTGAPFFAQIMGTLSEALKERQVAQADRPMFPVSVVNQIPARLARPESMPTTQLIGSFNQFAKQALDQLMSRPQQPATASAQTARSYRQVFNISTPNADSFRLSQRQIARRARGFVTA